MSTGGKGEHTIFLAIFKDSVLLAKGYAVLGFIYKTYKNVDQRRKLKKNKQRSNFLNAVTNPRKRGSPVRASAAGGMQNTGEAPVLLSY